MNKMKDYIIKSKEVFIGLEDSKRTWKISVRCEKMEVHYASMPAHYDSLRSYIRKNYPRCKVSVIYEAGFKGFGLHDKLVEDGFECVVTPPNKVTQEKDHRVKTDKIDCRRLAKNLENGDYKACFVPDEERRHDRQISRTLVAVQKDIVRTCNRIRRFLEFHGIDEKVTTSNWRKTDYDHLDHLNLSPALSTSLDVYQTILATLRASKKRLEKELKALAVKERYARLCSIFDSAPGIGWFTAIRLVLEWGEDLKRFTSAKEFASFTGLTCREYSTGDTRRQGRITGQSHYFMRGWLVELSWIAIKKDPVLMDKFKSVWKNSGSKKKAIVAVARKLAVRLWRCGVNNERYTIGLVSVG